ncbi:MAG: hypothetical protein ABT01_06190 [Clostridium sp. SCN 57-10]|nr:MAG: hypothetical protein ABT01_06190 [Clostridium sp. SCN 57-10]
MRVLQTFSMAMKSIAHNKMRSFLTMLGIIIGVCSVITLVSTIQGFQRQTMEQFNKMGTNRINIYTWDWNSAGPKNIANDLYTYCLTLGEEVAGMTPQSQTYTKLRYKTKNLDSRVYFGNDQFDACFNYELVRGRSICYADIRNRTKVCVLGSRIQQEFFSLIDPIGKKIKIKGVEYTVIGVFESKFDNMQGSNDDMILVPVSLQGSITGSKQITEFVVKAADSKATEKAISKLRTFLTAKLGENQFSVWSDNSWMESQNDMLKIATLVVAGVAGISLLVGGIGIMNIMLVSVAERTREIGIRMAIGARRRDIVTQFLIEAATISACGGVLGILFGTLGSAILSAAIFKKVFYPSIAITIGAFAFSVMLGIFFGIYPALKASKMQPVEALRNQ